MRTTSPRIMVARIIMILPLAVFLAGTGPLASAGTEGKRIDAPAGKEITLDGRLSDGEWSEALRVELTGGGAAFLKHAGAMLLVGIRAVKPGFPTIFIDRGDEVALLHASAALGTMIYHRKEDTWTPAREFTWEVRQTGNDPEALAARRKFLEDSGWVGSTIHMGEPLETEIMIRADWAGSAGVRLAIAWLGIDEPMKGFWWPAELDDDVRRIRLLQGFPENAVVFRTEAWPVVVSAKSASP